MDLRVTPALILGRRGALALAAGGILGGNTFDVLFTAFADVGFESPIVMVLHVLGMAGVVALD